MAQKKQQQRKFNPISRFQSLSASAITVRALAHGTTHYYPIIYKKYATILGKQSLSQADIDVHHTIRQLAEQQTLTTQGAKLQISL